MRLLLRLLLLLAILQSWPALATDLYWVGGTASWDGTAGTKWALSSGGAGGQPIPTSSDNVFIDSGSGAVTVTVAAGNTGCKDLKFTSGAGSFAGTFAGSAALAISGDLLLSSAMTRSYTGALTFNSTASQTITSNTKTLASAIVFDGVAGSWALQDALVNADTITLTNGTLNLNNFDISFTRFISSNSNARTITSGTGQMNSTQAAGGTLDVFNFSTSTNLTLTDRPTWNFTAASIAGNTLRILAPVFAENVAPNINVTDGAATISGQFGANNVTFSGGFTGAWASTSNLTIYGSLTLKAGMTVSASTNVTIFAATSGTKTITSAGVTIDRPITFNGIGGTWRFADALTQGSTRTLTLTNGTLDGNGQSVSIGTFALGSGTKTLTLGSGTWTVQGSGASAWNANTNVSGLTVTASTGKISMTSASAKTFAGGAKSWPTLDQGGTGDLTVAQANTFGDIQWSAAGKIILPASTTTTVSAFTGPVAVAGTLESSSAGTAATLSKASGTVSVSTLSIKDSAATGGATFQAYTVNGNTDVSGNTGWIFTAPGGGLLLRGIGALEPANDNDEAMKEAA